ncbi:hypothetical protein BDZ89DRAFT_1152899 [Hymenopellis radicata]|nr:hypothetical protein BDZ89DRAFT_1152899 [Hymenopellis radicata]
MQQRPTFCSTCKNDGKGDDCQYDDGIHASVKDQLLGRIRYLEASLRVYEQDVPPEPDPPVQIDSPATRPSFLPGDAPFPGSSQHDGELQMPPEIDFTPLRQLFSTHHAEVGLCLTDDKVAALIAGDLSGAIIHPVLVYASQLWGCLLQADNSHFRLITESVKLQNTIDALNSINKPADATPALQAY